MTAAINDATAAVHAAGFWWRIHLGDRWGSVVSDDLTLDEVELLERTTGVPWARANPLASLPQAKAWLLVAAVHAGATEQEAAGHVASLNLGKIKGAFQLHSGDRPPDLEALLGEVPEAPPTSVPTSGSG